MSPHTEVTHDSSTPPSEESTKESETLRRLEKLDIKRWKKRWDDNAMERRTLSKSGKLGEKICRILIRHGWNSRLTESTQEGNAQERNPDVGDLQENHVNHRDLRGPHEGNAFGGHDNHRLESHHQEATDWRDAEKLDALKADLRSDPGRLPYSATESSHGWSGSGSHLTSQGAGIDNGPQSGTWTKGSASHTGEGTSNFSSFVSDANSTSQLSSLSTFIESTVAMSTNSSRSTLLSTINTASNSTYTPSSLASSITG